MAMAMRMHAERGWRIVAGFAIFGIADQPNVYVAQRRWWNEKDDGAWIDCTARDDVVLAESALGGSKAMASMLEGPGENDDESAPVDERGKILAYRLVLSELSQAFGRAQTTIASRGLPSQGPEAAREIVTQKLEMFARFAKVADLTDLLAGNPLERLWRAVLNVLPRVLQRRWRSPDELTREETEEIAFVAGNGEGQSGSAGAPLVLASDEGDPLYLPGTGVYETYLKQIQWPLSLCYSNAIPTEEALQTLARLEMPICEIGAGTGYWGALLRARGVTCVLSDSNPASAHEKSSTWFVQSTYTEVIREDGVKAAARHPGHCLLLIWPYIDEVAASGAAPAFAWDAAALRAFKGDIVAHCGELDANQQRRSSLINTSPEFAKELAASFVRERTVELPNWAPVMRSELTIWRRIN